MCFFIVKFLTLTSAYGFGLTKKAEPRRRETSVTMQKMIIKFHGLSETEGAIGVGSGELLGGCFGIMSLINQLTILSAY
jgi:hypothetical protein